MSLMIGSLDQSTRPYTWRHQPDATISLAPVSGTPYTVLAATEDVRIISVDVICTWTVQPSPLEAHIVLDGVAYDPGFGNPVSNQDYMWFLQPYNLGGTLAATGGDKHDINKAFILEGQNASVTAEVTGGTVQNLSARVKWARLLPT